MLLVDCYNLLHAPMPEALAGLEEVRLCRLLACSQYRRRPMVVVCDGVVKPQGPVESPVAEVELIYAGSERSADDLIISEIDRYSAPRYLTVVSNDRQIRKAARRRRAKLCSCQQMIHHLVQIMSCAAPSEHAHKPIGEELSDDEAHRWAKEFGLDPHKPFDGQLQ